MCPDQLCGLLRLLPQVLEYPLTVPIPALISWISAAASRGMTWFDMAQLPPITVKCQRNIRNKIQLWTVGEHPHNVNSLTSTWITLLWQLWFHRIYYHCLVLCIQSCTEHIDSSAKPLHDMCFSMLCTCLWSASLIQLRPHHSTKLEMRNALNVNKI